MIAQAQRLRKQGLSHFKIAQQLGVTLSEVRRALDHRARRANRRWKGLPELTWENAEWANGPMVVAWLDSQGIKFEDGAPKARSAGRWRGGSQARFHILDELLVRHERHVSELPDEVWEDRYEPSSRDFAPRYCRRCGEQIERGLWNGALEPPSRYQMREFCSRKCRSAQRETRTCGYCGEEFEYVAFPSAESFRGSYCSRKCSLASGRDTQRERRQARKAA